MKHNGTVWVAAGKTVEGMRDFVDALNEAVSSASGQRVAITPFEWLLLLAGLWGVAACIAWLSIRRAVERVRRTLRNKRVERVMRQVREEETREDDFEERDRVRNPNEGEQTTKSVRFLE